ncbi:thaumatin-like protein [Quercus suber]|uniref:Thaumatin-like protein n=1 Tax=Quercus suber TaxID=58331 RepID=A0AAW0JTS7_QUESU|nr:thaumatin-like protein [Quercus suber]
MLAQLVATFGLALGAVSMGLGMAVVKPVTVVDFFNVKPMAFSPTSGRCARGIRFTADINGQCLAKLRAQGGCNNLCTVFKTDEYCCNSESCGPTNYSKFFKDHCPDAYSYPKDDQTSTFTCKGGTNYKVVFCP